MNEKGVGKHREGWKLRREERRVIGEIKEG